MRLIIGLRTLRLAIKLSNGAGHASEPARARAAPSGLAERLAGFLVVCSALTPCQSSVMS